eukprot:jgi/Tetstr1/420546/TSEL_011636.t1
MASLKAGAQSCPGLASRGSIVIQVPTDDIQELLGDTVDDVMGVGEDPVGEDGMDIDAPAWPPAGVEPAMRA